VFHRHLRNVVFPVFVGLTIVTISGCGPAKPPTGTVQGKIMIGGGPPTERLAVYFINSMIGQGSMSAVDVDGSYQLPDPLRPAEYTVYFERLVVAEGEVSTNQQVAGTVPAAYRSEVSSPLKKTVAEGPNTIDLDIPTGEK
jgi:hypothetical protein